MIKQKLKKYFGPSMLVTAAFIGPGTLTVCTISGASFGYTLLWVLLFATLSAIVLQEMTARLGLITQSGFGEAIRKHIENPILKSLSIVLVFVAIIIGNAAYEAGNISGASLGVSGIIEFNYWPLVIGIIAFCILFTGKFQIIETALIVAVVIMSLVFLLTAIISGPNLSELISGLFTPHISADNQWMVIALIGTTVVPYNLFLHASSVSTKWKSAAQLKDVRVENRMAIGLGGLISMAIVITSAASIYGEDVKGVNEMADQLEPLLGSWAKYFLAIGLFAAGISSSITAPLAAAYAAKGIFGWKGDLTSTRFRIIWIGILAIGVLFSMLGYKPVEVIRVAQVANGILLPIIVVFLIYICNKKSLLGEFINSKSQNLLGVAVIIITLLISLRSLNNVFHFI